MTIPSRLLPVAAMILLPALVRTMPYILGALGMTDIHSFTAYLWNFSPISALFLFGGAKFSDRRMAYWAPLAAMVLSDLSIGLLMRDMSFGFHAMTPLMYATYGLIVWLGTLLQRHRSVFAIGLAAFAGEVVFFIVTNFATWVVQTGYYPHTPTGLLECYVAAIPFFRNSLTGIAIYTPLLFGGFAAFESRHKLIKAASCANASHEQTTGA